MKLSECTLCHLHETRKCVVTARGTDASGIMMVGEAPGQDENALGQPFVGKSGAILSKWISALDTDPEPISALIESEIYITNTVKCWPPTEDKKNRAPTEDEITACSSWLDTEISIVDPWLIVALGGTAVGRLTGIPDLGSRVGTLEWSTYGIPVLITYHPAYIARNAVVGIEAWTRDFAFLKRALTMKQTEWHGFKKMVREIGSVKTAEDH